MKSILKVSSLCILVVLVFAGCRYEDGPFFSFRSPRKRVCQEWKFEKYLVNDIDSTSNFKGTYFHCDNYHFYYTDGHDVILSRGCNGGNLISGNLYGFWALTEGARSIIFQIDSEPPNDILEQPLGPNVTWDINRLTNNEFWLNRNSNGKKYEIHFKAL